MKAEAEAEGEGGGRRRDADADRRVADAEPPPPEPAPEAVAPPPASLALAAAAKAEEEAARFADCEARNQCTRDPRCTRGFKHMSRGGPCRIRTAEEAAAEAERMAAAEAERAEQTTRDGVRRVVTDLVRQVVRDAGGVVEVAQEASAVANGGESAAPPTADAADAALPVQSVRLRLSGAPRGTSACRRPSVGLGFGRGPGGKGRHSLTPRQQTAALAAAAAAEARAAEEADVERASVFVPRGARRRRGRRAARRAAVAPAAAAAGGEAFGEEAWAVDAERARHSSPPWRGRADRRRRRPQTPSARVTPAEFSRRHGAMGVTLLPVGVGEESFEGFTLDEFFAGFGAPDRRPRPPTAAAGAAAPCQAA